MFCHLISDSGGFQDMIKLPMFLGMPTGKAASLYRRPRWMNSSIF